MKNFTFRNSLEKRAEEAIEFFQNENDDSKTSKTIEETNAKCDPIENYNENFDKIENVADTIENDMDTALIGDDLESISKIDQSHSSDPGEAVVQQSQAEKMEISSDDILAEDLISKVDKDAGISTSQHIENSAPDIPIFPTNSGGDTSTVSISEPVPTTSENQTPTSFENIPKFTEFHTKKTQLDLDIDSIALPGEKKLSLLSSEYAPRLKGKQGMVIDLETNELKEKEKTGIDELFERFLKHSGKCLTKKEPEEIRYSLFKIRLFFFYYSFSL